MKNSIKTIVLVIALFSFVNSHSNAQTATNRTETYEPGIRLNVDADAAMAAVSLYASQTVILFNESGEKSTGTGLRFGCDSKFYDESKTSNLPNDLGL